MPTKEIRTKKYAVSEAVERGKGIKGEYCGRSGLFCLTSLTYIIAEYQC